MICNPFRHDADNSQTMTNTHKPYSPSAKYRYFLYDPNDGNTFYCTPEERDIAAKNLIEDYLDDGEWSEQVVDIYAGEVTHQATEVERLDKVGELDEDGYDENGEYWRLGEVDYKCNCELQPLLAPALPEPDDHIRDGTEMVASPAEGEVGELVDFLERLGSDHDDLYPPQESITLYRAADLLRQQAAELAALGRPSQPPARGEQDELVAWLSNPLNHLPAAILIQQQAGLSQKQDAELAELRQERYG